MRKVYIVHGWEGYPQEGWFPWLRGKLVAEGFEVKILSLPSTDEPTLAKWLPVLQKEINDPDLETFLVGHSLGCITILRYIESLPKNSKIGGAVLVGGFGHDLEYPSYKGELKSFFAEKIDWSKIRDRAARFVAIHSDDDPWVPLKHNQLFVEKLKAESVIEHAKKHFSGDDGVDELPSAFEAVIRISASENH